ncbi:MAG: hypothetical protein WC869_04540 [Phycisphaerae bacterium]|jgi:hypothetical protein
MKKLFTLILLTAAFAVGYQMGHRPGSADLEPFAKDCAAKAVTWVEYGAAYIKSCNNQAKPQAPQAATTTERGITVSEAATAAKQVAAVIASVDPEGQIFAQAPEEKRRR